MLKRHFTINLHHFTIFLVILGSSILSVVPAFTNHLFKLSFDGNIHLSRFESITQSLKHLVLPPPVNFIGLKHTGLAMNGMYPWLSSTIFVIPKLLFENPILALMIGFTILNFITIFNTFLLAKFITPKRWLQLLGVIIYQFSSYHMTVLYSRNALGEALAYAFLPLVLLGCLKIWKNIQNGWLYLGIGMGAIANSHIISLIICTILIFILVCLRIINHRLTRLELFNYMKATILAIFLSLYALTNIFTLMSSNLLLTPTPKVVPLSPIQVWQAVISNSILEKAGSFNMGPINTILLIGLTFMLFTNKNGSWRSWTIATTTLFFITFDWFPWELLKNTPVTIIQFLGRLLFITSLLLSISTMYYFEQYPPQRKDAITIFSIALVTVSLSAVFNYSNTVTKDGNRYWLTTANYDKTIKSSLIGYDYLPANNNDQLHKRIIALKKSSKLKVITQTYNGAEYSINISRPGMYSLPIAIYSGVNYTVSLNNKPLTHISSHSLKLKLKKGYNHIKITTAASFSNYLTMAISLLTGLYSLLMLWFYKFPFYKVPKFKHEKKLPL